MFDARTRRWIIAAGLWAGAAAGADIFVSPSGDDARDGSSAQTALRSIAAAVDRARPGDTVRIAPGRYVERVRMPRSGEDGAPITLRRDGDGDVVWTTPPEPAARFQDRYALAIEGREHIVVEGLTFRDCDAWIVLWDANRCTIRDCVFDGARLYNAFRINNGSFNRILNCRFERGTEMTGFRQESDWIPVPGCDYIEIFRGSHNNLVQGCRFGAITHVAVSISAVDPAAFTPSRNIVRDNVFQDPFWKCLWIHAGAHNVFEDNLCTGRAANFVQLESGRSILRRNRFVRYRDSTGGQPDIRLRGALRMQFDFSRGNRIYQNLFHDNERTLTNNSFRGQVTDNIFQNNILAGNGQTVFLGFPDYAGRNRNYFFSNVLRQAAPGERVIRLAGDDFTLAAAQSQLPELYADNIEADPGLVLDGEGMPVGLRPDSPCIAAGRALTQTRSAGRGTELPVVDALWFCDGNGLIPGDDIAIGGARRARIVRVDYEHHRLELDAPTAWAAGESVSLAHRGAAPTIGPFDPP